MSIDEVRTLVAERQRYDDWLSALEAKRSETPARVFERVYGDYFARRSGVIERLREHVDALTTLGDDLEGRIGALETQLAAHEDERAEAMLRTAVGEYDSDRWETVRQEVEANIAQLGEQRSALLSEVDDVRTLLSSARSEPPPMPAPPDAGQVAAPVVEATAAVPERVEVPVVDERPNVVSDIEASRSEASADVLTQTGPTRDAAEDELFAERAHQTLTPGVAVPVTEAATYVPPTDDDLDGTDFDDALALFSPSPRTPEQQATPLHGRSVDVLDGFEPAEGVPEPQRPPAAVATAPAVVPEPVVPDAPTEPARDPFDDLAFLRSVIDPATQNSSARGGAAGDQQKTLRCTECGTMNFPTEWYCERCGGELAAF